MSGGATPTPSDTPVAGQPRRRSRRWLGRIGVAAALAAALMGGLVWFDRREPQPHTDIFRGVRYGCDRLDASDEGRGLLHWVQIDLSAPGIELFVTPLDLDAVRAGWQYRLRRTGDVLAQERLAVVINATLFTSDSGWVRWPGDWARSLETVVADHVVSHEWEHTYLLAFDDRLFPRLKPSKPPTAADLAEAKWGIGGQAVGLQGGKMLPGASRVPDARTAVAIDRDRKLLVFAVAESISPRLMLEKLAELGAKDAMLLDGGGSTSMALGAGAHGVRPGVLIGGWRPVATFFGVRAEAIGAGK
jgi:hypothetical protein